MTDIAEALANARLAVEEYARWGARHTPLYIATKELIEAVEKETS